MILEVTSLQDERIAMFSVMTKAQLRNRLNAEQGIFIAETPNVIERALHAGYEPLSYLIDKKLITDEIKDEIDKYYETYGAK